MTVWIFLKACTWKNRWWNVAIFVHDKSTNKLKLMSCALSQAKTCCYSICIPDLYICNNSFQNNLFIQRFDVKIPINGSLLIDITFPLASLMLRPLLAVLRSSSYIVTFMILMSRKHWNTYYVTPDDLCFHIYTCNASVIQNIISYELLLLASLSLVNTL